jgi:hypothetical protein
MALEPATASWESTKLMMVVVLEAQPLPVPRRWALESVAGPQRLDPDSPTDSSVLNPWYPGHNAKQPSEGYRQLAQHVLEPSNLRSLVYNPPPRVLLG